MAKQLKWHRGVPDSPGFWWLLPDKEYSQQVGGPTGPSIIEVRRQNDIVPQKPELYMQYRDFRLEAYLFKGMVAGPISQPIGA